MTDSLIDQILNDPHSAIGVLVPPGMSRVATYSALCDILVELDPEKSNDMPTDVEFEKLSSGSQLVKISLLTDTIDSAIWYLDSSLYFDNFTDGEGVSMGWQIAKLS